MPNTEPTPFITQPWFKELDAELIEDFRQTVAETGDENFISLCASLLDNEAGLLCAAGAWTIEDRIAFLPDGELKEVLRAKFDVITGPDKPGRPPSTP